MIVGDISGFRDLGARQQASDLCLVLNCFLADFPEARMALDSCECSNAESDVLKQARTRLTEPREIGSAGLGGGAGVLANAEVQTTQRNLTGAVRRHVTMLLLGGWAF